MKWIWERVVSIVAAGAMWGGTMLPGATPLLAKASIPHPVAPLAGELLQGRTIIIDPGHGGFDPGALGMKSREDLLNLSVGLRLKQLFQESGARVLMTWSRPEDIPAGRKLLVKNRVHWINQMRGDVLIDIHCNSAGRTWKGPQTFYWGGSASYYLAHDVQEELQYMTQSRRSVTRINQYVLKHAHMPAINVEIGFISNPQEEVKLMNPQYQDELAWAMFIGTERWFMHGRWPEQKLKAPPHTHLLKR